MEIYELPKINEKSVQNPQPIYFSDLPNKEIIRNDLRIESPVMKAPILFIASIGCARAEALSLTIQNYIDILSEYLPFIFLRYSLIKTSRIFSNSSWDNDSNFQYSSKKDNK